MEYQSKKYVYDNFRTDILPYISISAKKILEIGCGTGKFASLIKERQSCEIWGVEKNHTAAKICRGRIDRVLNLEIEKAFLSLPKAYFDTICLLDVLEYLVDPWLVLFKLRSFLRKNGVVIASIPNIRYFHVCVEFVLKKTWEYKEWGVMDRTHLRFFTYYSIKKMFWNSGFDILKNRRNKRNPFKKIFFDKSHSIRVSLG